MNDRTVIKDKNLKSELSVVKAKKPAEKIQRLGHVIKIKPEKIKEYKMLHVNVWPSVVKMIKNCNIINYSIFFKDCYLFSYMEYVGNNFETDMKKMADDPNTQQWWKLTDPCQEPLETRKDGERWAIMEEFFHLD